MKHKALIRLRGSITKIINFTIDLLKRERDIYPVFVFALLPSLVFWTQKNIPEITLGLMSRVLFWSAITGAIIYGVCYLFLGKDRFKASILAIITIIVTFTYGQLFGYYDMAVAKVRGENSRLGSHMYFLLLLAAIYLCLAILIKNRLKFSKTIRSYLAIFATALLIFNTYPLLSAWLTNRNLKDITFGSPVMATANTIDGEGPDIYYLIFDRYANQKVLKNVYDFDNTQFLDSLTDKGFYLAEDSAANYPFTAYSLSSSLNLDYLPEAQNKSSTSLFASVMHDKIENNRAVDFLKTQGYEFINIGPWWNITKYNKNADLDLYNPTGPVVLNKKIDLYEHELLLFQDTILWPILSKLPMQVGPHKVYGLTYPTNEKSTRAIHRQTNFHQFEMVRQASKMPGPQFVFAHFLLPHEPYIFNDKCKPLASKDEYLIYIQQLQCANLNIEKTVDYIMKNSESEPIIIIQSDEGPYPLELRKNKNLEWSSVPNELLQQKEQILNAYYFPDQDYSRLYQDISPVNTFRIVFNQYLGTELPMLEDRHFFPESSKRKFHLFEVTEKLRD